MSGPFFVLEQATGIPGLAIAAALWVLLMAWLIIRRRPPAHRWAPLLLLPIPWIVLMAWARANARVGGEPQTVADPVAWSLAMLGVSVIVSALVVVRAKNFRWAAAGLVVLNAWFCLIAALLAVMTITGSWL